MEWQGVCSDTKPVNEWTVGNMYESPDHDVPLDLSMMKKSNDNTTFNGSQNTPLMASNNHNYKSRIPFRVYDIQDEPLDLSMKCCPSMTWCQPKKCCPQTSCCPSIVKCVSPQGNKLNGTFTAREMGISVLPDRQTNNTHVSKDANRRLVKVHPYRQKSFGHLAKIPTNPDSAVEDLTMIFKRLELVVLKHYGYMLNIDKKSVITKNALETYKTMESKFIEMIYEPVEDKDYTDVLHFCQMKWKTVILWLREFRQTTNALIRNFPHFNKFEPNDQQNLIKYAIIGFDILNNLSLTDFEHSVRIWTSKDGNDACIFGEGFLPSFYLGENGKSFAVIKLKKLFDLNLSVRQLILLRCMHVYSKEFAVTGAGYLMASKIQYLLSEAMRHSIEKHQKDETLLPRVMTIMQTDFLEFIKLRTSVRKDMQDKVCQLFEIISAGALTPEQCRKWVNER